VCEALLAVFVTLAAFGLKRGGEPVVVLTLGAVAWLLRQFMSAAGLGTP